jgi:hypothetical protein
MESDCCGSYEMYEDSGICAACGEHADWNSDDEEDEYEPENENFLNY